MNLNDCIGPVHRMREIGDDPAMWLFTVEEWDTIAADVQRPATITRRHQDLWGYQSRLRELARNQPSLTERPCRTGLIIAGDLDARSGPKSPDLTRLASPKTLVKQGISLAAL